MCINPLAFYIFQYSVGYAIYPSLSVSCHSDLFWWHTWESIARLRFIPPLWHQSPTSTNQLRLTLIQSHNQAGWSHDPPAGKSPALILHLIWNEFTPGCGRKSAEELSDVRRWLSIRMWISIFAILKRFDKPWKARAFSNAPLATSPDSRLFPPPSQILGYCSSQTPLCCCHAQSCLVHLLSNSIWQQLN